MFASLRIDQPRNARGQFHKLLNELVLIVAEHEVEPAMSQFTEGVKGGFEVQPDRRMHPGPQSAGQGQPVPGAAG
jgi:hypothetical protein